MSYKILVNLVAIIGMLTVLAGCSVQTPYQSMSARGGYQSQNVPGGFVKVMFFANTFTKPKLVKAYTMLRIAQIGMQKHKKYFEMYKSISAAAAFESSEQPAIDLTFNEPMGYAYVHYGNKKQFNSRSVAKTYKEYVKYAQSKRK